MSDPKRIKVEHDKSVPSNMSTNHIQFARTFAHVEGNWPSHIYLQLDILNEAQVFKLESIFSDALHHFFTSHPHAPKDLKDIALELHPHISLSKSFVLRHHHISRFTEKMQREFSSNYHRRFPIDIDCRYRILLNDSKTRAFLCLIITEPSTEILKSLVKTADSLLESFSQPRYYEDPIFHMSIASWIPTIESIDAFSNDTIIEVAHTFHSIQSYFKLERFGCEEDMSTNSPADPLKFDIICRNKMNMLETELLSYLLGDYASDDDEIADSKNEKKNITCDEVSCKTIRFVVSVITAEIGNKIFHVPFS